MDTEASLRALNAKLRQGMEGRQQRACWTKGATWQRGHQVGGGGEYTGVEAGAKTARAECPHWMGKRDTLAVSWGLQRWAETGSHTP